MSRFAIIFLSLSMIAAFQLLMVQSGVTPLRYGDLVDSDAYMHLLRVQQLYETGRWYDPVSPRSNAPFGEVMHWSRLFDLLLLAGGWVGAFFTEFRAALYAWGLLISPVLQGISVIVLYWGTRPYLSRPGFLLVALLFAAQPHIELNFLYGRPDHHGLQFLLLTAVLAALLRYFAEPSRRGLVALAAFATGLSMWVTVEALLVVLIVSGAIGTSWLRSGGRDARDLFTYNLILLATLALALGIERPPDEWLAIEYDRLSMVQMVLVATLAIAAAGIALGNHYCRNLRDRLLLAGIAALLPAIVMGVGFPKFFGGPFVDMDPGLGPAWMDSLADAQPLLPTSKLLAVQFFVLLGPALICVPYLTFRLVRKRSVSWRADLLLLIGMLTYTAEGLYHQRAAGFAQVLFVLPWTWVLVDLWKANWRLPIGGGLKLPIRGLSCVAVLLGHAFVAAIFAATLDKAPTEDAHMKCPWSGLFAYLEKERPNEGRGILLTPDLYHGPEILYRTSYSVVGTPYHRNEDGILDSYNFFMTTDDGQARAIAERRGIDLVLLCRPREDQTDQAPRPEALSTRLKRRHPPPWLEPLAVPADIADMFVLYRRVP